MRELLRRLWWATLPYYGWTGGSKEQRREDEKDGAIPCPWYAFPLSWLHSLVDFVYRGDVFGPKHNRDRMRIGAPRWRPWQ